MIPPRLFALTQPVDENDAQVVGYGMVLPDGKAYSISWHQEKSGASWHGGSAEELATVRNARLIWIFRGS